LPTRRTILKRAAMWTAAAVLLLVWYIGTAPVVSCSVASSPFMARPTVLRALNVFYAPLRFLRQHPEIPGSTEFDVYSRWYQRQHEEFFDVQYRMYPD